VAAERQALRAETGIGLRRPCGAKTGFGGLRWLAERRLDLVACDGLRSEDRIWFFCKLCKK